MKAFLQNGYPAAKQGSTLSFHKVATPYPFPFFGFRTELHVQTWDGVNAVWVLEATSMLPNVAMQVITSLLDYDLIHCEFVVFKRLMWKKKVKETKKGLQKGI